MHRNPLLLGLPVMFAFAVAACSAPAIPESQNDALEVSPRAPRSSLDGSAGPAVDSGTVLTPAPAPAPTEDGGATPAPTSCNASAGFDACVTCCDAPSGGALARGEQAAEDCACGAGGACTAVCAANYCSGQKNNAACEACLTGTCDALTCKTPACLAAQQCIKTSCSTK